MVYKLRMDLAGKGIPSGEGVGFEREVQGALGVGFLGCLRLGGEQHGAAAVCLRPIDVAVLARYGESLERTLPVAVAALQVEQRIRCPGELGIERHGPLCEVARRLGLVLALSFEEQAAQTELLGIW